MSKTGKDRYDIIVVGAGPAGCAASLEAHRRGLSVKVIVSKSRADAIEGAGTSFQALQNLTQDEDALGMMSTMGFPIKPAHVYSGALIHGPFGRTVTFRLNRPHGYFVKRGGTGSLDAQMVEGVEDGGIPIDWGARVVSVKEDGSIEFKTREGRCNDRAEVIIGADGRATVVGQGIVAPLKSRDLAIGLGYHFKGHHGFEPGTAECWLGSDLCPGEYSYVLPSEEEVTVMTTMRPHLLSVNDRPEDYLHRLMAIPSIKERLKGAEPVCDVFGSVPVCPGGPLGRGRILLAGEAARLTDPLLGFGIMNAVRSGHIAGGSTAEEEPLAFYERELRRSMLMDLRRRMAVRSRIVDSLDDRTIEELLDLADSMLSCGEPDRLFEPDGRWKWIMRSILDLPNKGQALHSLRYLLPLMAANFSFRNSGMMRMVAPLMG